MARVGLYRLSSDVFCDESPMFSIGLHRLGGGLEFWSWGGARQLPIGKTPPVHVEVPVQPLPVQVLC